MDDQEAIEATLSGNREAFGFLVSQYQAKVYAVALARVYDRQDAQDLCQEAFLRAYLRLPTLRNRDAFAPWLFMILRRLCVDFVRGKWRKELGEQAMKRNQGDTEDTVDPQHDVAATDAAETLWAHIGQLDDSSREVLSLHYGQDLKVSEIAALTGVRESAVKMRLQRARSRLGDQAGHLKGAWGIAPVPALSAGIMKAVTNAGPLKGGIAASSSWLGGAAVVAALSWAYVAVFAVAIGAAFKREIDLISPRDKLKQLAFAGGALLLMASMVLRP
ncbi:MAG: RNA polymerase sigma factor, partial [FCB group bacterium]|nr:RNA polymerase sigma factor [FCB group bacterium]